MLVPPKMKMFMTDPYLCLNLCCCWKGLAELSPQLCLPVSGLAPLGMNTCHITWQNHPFQGLNTCPARGGSWAGP